MRKIHQTAWESVVSLGADYSVTVDSQVSHSGPNKEEADFLVRSKKLDLIDLAIRLMVPWGALVAIAYWIHADIVALAGKQTLAQIGLSFMGDIKISDAVAYVFGAAGAGYGMAERTLRRKTIARLADENRRLEQMVDPQRTSSNLTRHGTTRPEDQKW